MKNSRLKEVIHIVILLLEVLVLAWAIEWFRKDPTNNEAFFKFLSALIAFVSTLLYFTFKKDKNSMSNISNNNSLISAKVIEHLGDERRKAFNELRQNITKGDEIWILGTGVTSFLNDRENLEIYLKNGARIKILMLNDRLLRNTRECQEELFIKKNFAKITNLEELNKLGADVLCDIESYNFLIQKKHFDKYFGRKNYHQDVQESYQIIEKLKKQIIEDNWEGELKAKHFKSFLPLSMTAIKTDTNKKMIIEFILPFSDKRLMVKSSSNENKEIYDLFIEFFNNTWKNSNLVEQYENR